MIVVCLIGGSPHVVIDQGKKWVVVTLKILNQFSAIASYSRRKLLTNERFKNVRP